MDNPNNRLMELYFEEKDLFKRNQILTYLVLNLPIDGKEFFLKVFKKARYMDMRLTAVRGYAAYAAEEEVNVLMKRLLELLKKIPEHTPYDYQEYESMRSVFLMPYLLRTYNYECFQEFNEQLEKQYNAMPDCFKNIFTLDETGKLCEIRDPKEVSESWDVFYRERNKQTDI